MPKTRPAYPEGVGADSEDFVELATWAAATMTTLMASSVLGAGKGCPILGR